MALIDGAWNTGSFVGHLLLITTNKRPDGLEQDGRSRTAGARRRTAHADHCALHNYANSEIRRAAM